MRETKENRLVVLKGEYSIIMRKDSYGNKKVPMTIQVPDAGESIMVMISAKNGFAVVHFDITTDVTKSISNLIEHMNNKRIGKLLGAQLIGGVLDWNNSLSARITKELKKHVSNVKHEIYSCRIPLPYIFLLYWMCLFLLFVKTMPEDTEKNDVFLPFTLKCILGAVVWAIVQNFVVHFAKRKYVKNRTLVISKMENKWIPKIQGTTDVELKMILHFLSDMRKKNYEEGRKSDLSYVPPDKETLEYTTQEYNEGDDGRNEIVFLARDVNVNSGGKKRSEHFKILTLDIADKKSDCGKSVEEEFRMVEELPEQVGVEPMIPPTVEKPSPRPKESDGDLRKAERRKEEERLKNEAERIEAKRMKEQAKEREERERERRRRQEAIQKEKEDVRKRREEEERGRREAKERREHDRARQTELAEQRRVKEEAKEEKKPEETETNEREEEERKKHEEERKRLEAAERKECEKAERKRREKAEREEREEAERKRREKAEREEREEAEREESEKEERKRQQERDEKRREKTAERNRRRRKSKGNNREEAEANGGEEEEAEISDKSDRVEAQREEEEQRKKQEEAEINQRGEERKSEDISLEDFPFYDAISKLLEKITIENTRLYLYGGAVRDYLIHQSGDSRTLELKIIDFDIVAVGPHSDLINKISFATGCMVVGNRRKIVKVKQENASFDFSAVNSAEDPGLTEFVEGLDFTINSFVVDLKTKQLKYAHPNGFNDIKNKIIRTIKDPNVSLKEDPIRALRAIRLSAKTDFRFDDELLKAMKSESFSFADENPDRMFREFGRLFTEGYAVKNYNLLIDTGLIRKLFPGFSSVCDSSFFKKYNQVVISILESFDQRYKEDAKQNDFMLVLATFFWSSINVQLQRLEAGDLKGNQKRIVQDLIVETLEAHKNLMGTIENVQERLGKILRQEPQKNDSSQAKFLYENILRLFVPDKGSQSNPTLKQGIESQYSEYNQAVSQSPAQQLPLNATNYHPGFFDPSQAQPPGYLVGPFYYFIPNTAYPSNPDYVSGLEF